MGLETEMVGDRVSADVDDPFADSSMGEEARLLLYVEFISRRPAVSLEEFHRRAGRAQDTWAQDHGVDRILLNAGRSWRIGPEPEYVCIWYTPTAGLDRIDEWERLFADPGEREHHSNFEAVARIDRAGCYEPVGEPSAGERGRYLIEWLELDDISNAALAEHFRARADQHPQTPLRCLARPLGRLAPGDLGFAVWELGSWGQAEPLVRDIPDKGAGLTIRDASLYADFGQEQL